jgi:hypothetical protein
VVVDDVASEAVERGKRGDSREVSDHIGVGLHRLYRCKVAPLRVDDYLTLIRGSDEAGRDPAIELADDTFSIVTQELDELLLVLRLDGQDVDKGGDLFRHPMVVFMMFSSRSVVLCAYTMKTITAIKTDRSAQKTEQSRGDTCNSLQSIAKKTFHPAGPVAAVFSEDCELDTCMFLNHFKNFYPGVSRDRLIEVAGLFRIVASLGYLLVNSSVWRNQESLLRSRQIANALIEARFVTKSRPLFTNPVHLDVKPAIRKNETELPEKLGYRQVRLPDELPRSSFPKTRFAGQRVSSGESKLQMAPANCGAWRIIRAQGRGSGGMKSRIAIWATLGALVVVVWRIYISATLSNPLGADGVGRALVYLTCPIAMAGRHPQGFYFVVITNAATYALAVFREQRRPWRMITTDKLTSRY